ncbi:MAG: hypothetical protein Fur0037_05080 [Planctomycetota bacterium]
MGRAQIAIAPDGLTAQVRAGKGPPLSRADLERLVEEASVSFGILAERMDEAAACLADESWSGTVEIARGRPPEPGRDGFVDPPFRGGPTAGRLLPGGAIDFRERDLLRSAGRGEVIAEIVPPEPGTPGVDVRGMPIRPPQPKAATIRAGPGCRIEDGRVVALIDGVILRKQDKEIDVVELYEHRGDVDLHSGNLRVKGTLVVRGDVREGFSVSATGDALIRGAVFGAAVEAEGSVAVDDAVIGGSEVRAGGDLSCKHATAAMLHAEGTVRIHDQASHCVVRAGDFEMLRGRGHVVGGEVHATRSVKVLEAGTAVGARTVLIAADLTAEHAQAVRSESAGHKAERASRKMLVGASREGGRAKGGSLGRRSVLARDQALAQRLELARRQRELLADAEVAVRERIHPGVVVQLGVHRLEIQETMSSSVFCWDEETHSIIQVNQAKP